MKNTEVPICKCTVSNVKCSGDRPNNCNSALQYVTLLLCHISQATE